MKRVFSDTDELGPVFAEEAVELRARGIPVEDEPWSPSSDLYDAPRWVYLVSIGVSLGPVSAGCRSELAKRLGNAIDVLRTVDGGVATVEAIGAAREDGETLAQYLISIGALA